MEIKKTLFGAYSSTENVYNYTIQNKNNMKVTISTYGATLLSLFVPDRNGEFHDILLGYDTLQNYCNGDKFFGAVIGRFANRIKEGKFTLNNKEYVVAINNGPNHLHGGMHGFDKKVWDIKNINEDDNSLELSYFSKDGEENYPGNLTVSVKYTLTDENTLEIEYYASCDCDTILNLTNHSYFNLGGHSSGNVLNQKLMINADSFTVNDKFSIPTGEIRNVKGTPMDFTTLTSIGKNINSDYEQIKFGNGFDHNYVLNSSGDINIKSAQAVSEETGIVLEMYTTQPGVQFYSANFLDGSDIGKENTHYEQRSAFCLETQHFPNCINEPKFASPILKANEIYNQKTIYKFSTM